MGRVNVGVFASGRGTDFQSLVDAGARDELSATIALLVCNVPDAAVIERARRARIPAVVIDHRPFGKDRQGWERKAVEALREHHVDLVVLAGFMRLLTPAFLDGFRNRVINVHPSLLPAFPGTHAQRDALRQGARVSGCTIHFVDESVDGGPIILQKAVPILPGDTEESLAARILEQEHLLLPLAVRLFAEGRLSLDGRRVRIDTTGIVLPPMV